MEFSLLYTTYVILIVSSLYLLRRQATCPRVPGPGL